MDGHHPVWRGLFYDADAIHATALDANVSNKSTSNDGKAGDAWAYKPLAQLEEEESEEMLYLQQLDGGLFTLQLIDYIIIDLCVSENRDISARIMKILSTRGSSLASIQRVVEGYADNLGTEESAEGNSEKKRISDMLKKLQRLA